MDFEEALRMLLHEEKISRNENNIEAHRRVLDEIQNLCIQHNEWKVLGESISLIIGKHGCIESTVQKLIQSTIKILEQIPNRDVRCNLIKKLRSVCDGKLFLEREHVELTRVLAYLYETDGQLLEAAKVLNELKIEAYAHLNQREKVEFILLQIRLLINSDQYDKASILSKKIQLKFFNDPENEDLKIKYYDMRIELVRGSSYLETSNYYQILSTCMTLNEESLAKMIVNSAIFCALAPKCREQIAFAEILQKDQGLKKKPIACELLRLLTSKELIAMSAVQKSFQAALNQSKVMKLNTRFAKKCLDDLNLRIIEHNILTIAKYYSRIRLLNMSKLIGTSVKSCEENITCLVNSGLLFAKIDRFTGIVDFSIRCGRECVLNSWFDIVSKIMDYTNRASHHVQNELAINDTHVNNIATI